MIIINNIIINKKIILNLYPIENNIYMINMKNEKKINYSQSLKNIKIDFFKNIIYIIIIYII